MSNYKEVSKTCKPFTSIKDDNNEKEMLVTNSSIYSTIFYDK